MFFKVKQFFKKIMGHTDYPSTIIHSGLPAKKYDRSTFSKELHQGFFRRMLNKIKWWCGL